MITWVVYDENGAPAPAMPIGPGGLELVDYLGFDLVDRTKPTIVNLGGGEYGFSVPTADTAAGVAFLVKNGTGFPAYVSGVSAPPTSPASVWALFDGDGALWTGAPATLSAFRGIPTSPPVVALRTYLMGVRPSISPVTGGEVSIIGAAPAGAEPAFFHDTLTVAAAAAPSSPAPAADSPVCLDAGLGADLSDVIELLASGCYRVSRPGTTSILNGRRIGPTFTTFDITASAQPASGRSIERLPEGLRSNEAMDVFTETELRQARPEAGVEGDRIAIDGAVFEVQVVRRWDKLGNFFRATVTRVSA